jgi:hypothetical protein
MRERKPKYGERVVFGSQDPYADSTAVPLGNRYRYDVEESSKGSLNRRFVTPKKKHRSREAAREVGCCPSSAVPKIEIRATSSIDTMMNRARSKSSLTNGSAYEAGTTP